MLSRIRERVYGNTVYTIIAKEKPNAKETAFNITKRLIENSIDSFVDQDAISINDSLKAAIREVKTMNVQPIMKPKRNKNTDEQWTALYCRLSCEDGDTEGDSNSIKNQKMLLKNMLTKNTSET